MTIARTDPGWVCLDASVAVKWLLDEVDRDRAIGLRREVRARGDAFMAPTLLPPEVASALYKREQQNMITFEAATALIEELEDLAISIVAPPGLTRRAYEIASRYAMKWIYDAFYVALADMVGCELWTADERLHELVSAAHPNVRLLSDYRMAS